MMKIENPEAKTDLSRRLQRIEGQVRGVRGMLEDERDCREIMQQLAAIQAAVRSSSRIFLQEYATTCLVESDGEGDTGNKTQHRQERERLVADLIALVEKTP
jgi:DNA-binding FrmR family transcriptional regulator